MIRTLDIATETRAPFFLHLALNDPHPPYAVPKPYDTMIDPMLLDLPPGLNDADPPVWHAKLLRDCGSASATEQDVRKVIACYYAMIAYANDQMKRLYDAIAQRGLLDNTWFIFTSDHGDFTGEHGAFCKCESLYECLLHVPLIIRPPDDFTAPRGKMYDGLVDLTDVFATIVRLAGIDLPSYVQGHDLIAWASQNSRGPLRDCVFAQVGDYHGNLKTTWPGGMPESGRHAGLVQGGRTLEFAFTRDPDNGNEAYDLRADPHELKNLLNHTGAAPPQQVDALQRSVDDFEQTCLKLREELAIVPGDRGYWDGLQR
jgi:arylsulfatase A-like enzyme